MQFHKTPLATALFTLTALLLTGCSSENSSEKNPTEVSESTPLPAEKGFKKGENKEDEDRSEDERPVVVHPDDEFPGLLMGEAGPDLETSWLSTLTLTGDYMTDLENLGLSYQSQEHLDALLELHDDRYCAGSLTEPVNRMTLLSGLKGDFSTGNVDFARTYVAYNCPGRAETIDRLFIYIEVDQDEAA